MDNSTNQKQVTLSVTKISVDPEVLIRGDTALLTITVTNTGSSAMDISSGWLFSKEITVLNEMTYNSMRTIGPGSKMDFTFSILADQPDGIYYPTFYLDIRSSGSVKYSIPIQVEEPEISLSAIDIPRLFVAGRLSSITLLVGNPKNVPIKGIEIVPIGEGIITNLSSYFIGYLQPHNTTKLSFEITPSKETNLSIFVNYRSGFNKHSTNLSIPIRFVQDKLAAVPVITNVAFSTEEGSKVTGDIANCGLEDAYGMIISLKSADSLTNPNRKYVIGTLQSDDFSSFEIALPSSIGDTITLIIEYKDHDGNVFKNENQVQRSAVTSGDGFGSPGLSGSGGAAGRPGSFGSGGQGGQGIFRGFGNGMNKLPVNEIATGIIAILIAIIVVKLYKRFKRREKPKKPGQIKLRV